MWPAWWCPQALMQPLILILSSPTSRWRSSSAKRSAIFCATGIERAIEQYRTIREPGERFLDTYRRVGMDGFKEAIYGA